MAGAAAASAAAAAVASGISARPVAPRPSPSRARAPRSVVRAAISVEKGEKAYTVEKSEEIFNAAKVTRLLSFLSLLRGDVSPRASFRGGGGGYSITCGISVTANCEMTLVCAPLMGPVLGLKLVGKMAVFLRSCQRCDMWGIVGWNFSYVLDGNHGL